MHSSSSTGTEYSDSDLTECINMCYDETKNTAITRFIISKSKPPKTIIQLNNYKTSLSNIVTTAQKRAEACQPKQTTRGPDRIHRRSGHNKLVFLLRAAAKWKAEVWTYGRGLRLESPRNVKFGSINVVCKDMDERRSGEEFLLWTSKRGNELSSCLFIVTTRTGLCFQSLLYQTTLVKCKQCRSSLCNMSL